MASDVDCLGRNIVDRGFDDPPRRNLLTNDEIDAIANEVRTKPLSEVGRHVMPLVQHISKMEQDSFQLGEIRATLLVNFGDTKHNKYGFKIENEGTTLRLLMKVLENLTKEQRA